MRMILGVQLIAVFVVLTMLSCSQQKADLVLKNGVIYTVDESYPKAEAVAVSGDKIVAVAGNLDIETFIGEHTQVIDLEGKTVVPGFIDSHYHFMGVGRREFHLNLDGARSLQEFLDKVKAEASKKKPGEWVTGRGWIEEDWPSKTFPTRSDLDKVAPENPVILGRADGHAVVVNSRALEIAGITKESPNPQGGEIVRDRTGTANGLILDKAMALVRKHVPSDSDPGRMREYAKKADEIATAYGLTQIHEMGTSWRTIDLWKDMYEKDQMKIRIYAFVRGPGEDADRLLEEGPQIGLYNHKLTVRGIKISQDGALGSRGAALLEPYSDAQTVGLLQYKDEQIYPTIKKALERHVQMAIHAIGDRANRNILDLFELAFNEVPEEKRASASPRFRIEHAQIVALNDMPRFAELGVIPSMQPSHAIGDLHFAIRRLGLNRMTEGYAWRTYIDQGSIIPGGSDAPVEEGNPLIEFYAACVRKDTTGFSTQGWHPELKMTREEALKSLTIWGAHAAFEEEIKGSISVGKLADLVVLNQDLMTAPEAELFKIKVLTTVIGGEIVYQREKEFSQK
ncbi:MAG: amidohydrolase [bacterium]